nr:type III pantothenate kinase [uncultured Cetobacterium sp.]
MLLAVDIGNTHIVTGLIDETGKVLLSFRVSSNEKMTEDQFFSYLKNISDFNGIEIKNLNGIIISSVVPNLISIFQFLGRKYFNIEPMVVDLNLNMPFTFADHLQVTGFGPDRIIDIAQAVIDFPNRNLVIFDLGTATTYEVLKDGVYIGGGILPGIEMSINALFGNTARLPKVKFSTPESVLGKNTQEQIQAGIFYGYAGQIKNIILEIKKHVEDPYVIATGGLGKILFAEIQEIDEYIPELSLRGLYSLYKMNI